MARRPKARRRYGSGSPVKTALDSWALRRNSGASPGPCGGAPVFLARREHSPKSAGNAAGIASIAAGGVLLADSISAGWELFQLSICLSMAGIALMTAGHTLDRLRRGVRPNPEHICMTAATAGFSAMTLASHFTTLPGWTIALFAFIVLPALVAAFWFNCRSPRDGERRGA